MYICHFSFVIMCLMSYRNVRPRIDLMYFPRKVSYFTRRSWSRFQKQKMSATAFNYYSFIYAHALCIVQLKLSQKCTFTLSHSSHTFVLWRSKKRKKLGKDAPEQAFFYRLYSMLPQLKNLFFCVGGCNLGRATTKKLM